MSREGEGKEEAWLLVERQPRRACVSRRRRQHRVTIGREEAPPLRTDACAHAPCQLLVFSTLTSLPSSFCVLTLTVEVALLSGPWNPEPRPLGFLVTEEGAR